MIRRDFSVAYTNRPNIFLKRIQDCLLIPDKIPVST